VTDHEALEMARAFQAREQRRTQLLEYLRASDMIGLECPETVELEQLHCHDARDGRRLAAWIARKSDES
jgi:hypothetical protein